MVLFSVARRGSTSLIHQWPLATRKRIHTRIHQLQVGKDLLINVANGITEILHA